MKLYIINGFTDNVGQWELEIFKDYWEALDSFKEYIDEYAPEITKEELNNAIETNYIDVDEGHFWIDEFDI